MLGPIFGKQANEHFLTQIHSFETSYAPGSADNVTPSGAGAFLRKLRDQSTMVDVDGDQPLLPSRVHLTKDERMWLTANASRTESGGAIISTRGASVALLEQAHEKHKVMYIYLYIYITTAGRLPFEGNSC